MALNKISNTSEELKIYNLSKKHDNLLLNKFIKFLIKSKLNYSMLNKSKKIIHYSTLPSTNKYF